MEAVLLQLHIEPFGDPGREAEAAVDKTSVELHCGGARTDLGIGVARGGDAADPDQRCFGEAVQFGQNAGGFFEKRRA